MKSKLLPLPGTIRRIISLRHHAALKAMRQGYGDGDHWEVLTFSIYVAYLMECEQTGTKPDPEPYRLAFTALRHCLARAQVGEGWILQGTESDALAALLLIHDSQLWSYRSSCHAKAWDGIKRSAKAKKSPLADGNVLPRDDADTFELGVVPG
jgi:hypothetical protein